MRRDQIDAALMEQIKVAMFKEDLSALDRLAPCGCCCIEHYFLDCAAHIWMGCRGSYAPDRLERQGQGYRALLDQVREQEERDERYWELLDRVREQDERYWEQFDSL